MARRLGGLVVVVLVLASATGPLEAAARVKPRAPRVATESGGLLMAIWDRIVSTLGVPVAAGAGTPPPSPEGTDAGWEMDPNGSALATAAPRR